MAKNLIYPPKVPHFEGETVAGLYSDAFSVCNMVIFYNRELNGPWLFPAPDYSILVNQKIIFDGIAWQTGGEHDMSFIKQAEVIYDDIIRKRITLAKGQTLAVTKNYFLSNERIHPQVIREHFSSMILSGEIAFSKSIKEMFFRIVIGIIKIEHGSGFNNLKISLR